MVNVGNVKMPKRQLIDEVNASKFKDMPTAQQTILLRYNSFAQAAFSNLNISVLGVFCFLFITAINFAVFGNIGGVVSTLAALFMCWKSYGYWQAHKYFKAKAADIWNNAPAGSLFDMAQGLIKQMAEPVTTISEEDAEELADELNEAKTE